MSAARLSNLRLITSRAGTKLQKTQAQRGLQSCRILSKESAIHDEDRAPKVEREKQAQLADQKQGRNQWSDSLGSDSESIVKADRGELSTDKQTIKELQDESARAAQKEKEQKKD